MGVHDYVNLEKLPAVARNLVGLREALTDPAVWGLPDEACTVLSQPGSAGQVLDTVRERARKARDTLLRHSGTARSARYGHSVPASSGEAGGQVPARASAAQSEYRRADCDRS